MTKNKVNLGDADKIDAIMGALSFNPVWAPHIAALGRAYKIVVAMEEEIKAVRMKGWKKYYWRKT
jgi:hypothetical protein